LTYACVEGPRPGTQAESHLLRQLGCDLVGMTNVPEAFLAREAPLPAPEPAVRQALAGALITSASTLDDEQRAWLSVLQR
jgi:purine nucleoside phosphorylase